MDPAVARRCWREGLLFPGLISVVIIVWAAVPGAVSATSEPVLLAIYAWLSCSMLAAWLVKRLDDVGAPHWIVAPLLYIVGYGPLLCAMTAGAYIKELRRAEMRWEKTEKTGAVGEVT
jgi:hypothetical protein